MDDAGIAQLVQAGQLLNGESVCAADTVHRIPRANRVKSKIRIFCSFFEGVFSFVFPFRIGKWRFAAGSRLGFDCFHSLLIAGAHDMLPVEKAQEIHDGLSDSEFIVFDDSGHFAPVEELEKFKTVVYEFLGVHSQT